MVKQARTSKQSYLEVVGTDIRIPVPDDPEGERKAVAAHPEFKRLLEAARQAEAEGRLVPMEDAFAQLDAEIPLSPRQSKGTPGRTSSAGAPSPTRRGRPPADEPQGRLLIRVPASIHRELVARAAQERTTLNQLVLSYISRGLGADTAR